MTSIQTTPNSLTSSVGLKIGSVIGLIAFSGFYINSWQQLLSNHYAQQQPEVETIVTAVEIVPETVETPTVAATVTPITDPNAIAQLTSQLYTQIDQNWQQYPTFTENLVYQVSVNQTGAIAQYKTINPAAAKYINQTPIPQLSQATTPDQPQAEFLVVMAPSGSLQVNPWVAE
ncbi:MAG: hypothetical protein KFF72_04600 [Arthrospira sp. SH-MAG29]|nr:hypothetical protein [Arthrospira sp. SH-MAG29]MBS0015637.1 hypothetical protein [Arthrospira sp. SH-MAG29]